MENKAIKKILLVADTFFPEKNSAALMLNSLANHIHNEKIELLVVTPHGNPQNKIQILNQQSVLFDGTIVPKRTIVIDLNTYNSLPASEREIIYGYNFYEEQNNNKRTLCSLFCFIY